jgi:hypothetical protein
MTRIAAFLRKPRTERRLLVNVALLHLVVAALVRVLPFGRARQLLDRASASGARRNGPFAADPGIEPRVVGAVRTISAALPGATCLTEALVAGFLLRRRGCETTLCFGLSSDIAEGRPFDAHAWLEHRGATVIGARAIAYVPLHVSHLRCGPSPSAR